MTVLPLDEDQPALVRRVLAQVLDQADGHPARARRLLMERAAGDLQLLHALTAPFLLGIAAAVVQQGVTERERYGRAATAEVAADLPDTVIDQILAKLSQGKAPAPPAPKAATKPEPEVALRRALAAEAEREKKLEEKHRRAMQILGGGFSGALGSAGASAPPAAPKTDPPPPPPATSDRHAATMRALAQAYKKPRIE